MTSATRLAGLSLLDSLNLLLRQIGLVNSEDQAVRYLQSRYGGLNQALQEPLERLYNTDVGTERTAEGVVLNLAREYACQQRSAPQEQALTPLLQRLGKPNGGGDALAYPLTPLVEGVAYPDAEKPSSVPLVERLERRLETLAAFTPDSGVLLANLLGLLHEVGWCLPAPGAPGASFYDEARTAAAIAAVLGSQAPLGDKDAPRFLLVVGDLAGIQNHIYRIQSAPAGTGALAKRLRARSLEVSLTAEAIVRDILQRVTLPITQRIMSAGGKFYLLLEGSANTQHALLKVKADWEAYSLEQGASLVPSLAWVSFAGRDFANFSGVLRRAHEALARAKLQPLSSQLASPYLFALGAARPCAAYPFLPAQAQSDVSEQAERDRHLGAKLPRTAALTFTSLAHRGEAAFVFPSSAVALGEARGEVLRSTFDFVPSAVAWEVKPLLGHLPTVGEVLVSRGWSLESYRQWLTEEGLETSERDDLKGNREARDPLTFGELAALSEGVPLLGVLMLDADRMGELFTKALPQAGASQIATLSRQLEAFFAGEVANLIRAPKTYAKHLAGAGDYEARSRAYPLIYSVYAGGDDLFLLGPWHTLLDFAQDLNRLYARYTRNPALSLSGGFALVRPKLPIMQISDQLKTLEREAKAANVRTLVQQQTTGHLALFGDVVSWADLETLQGWAEKLTRDLNEKQVSSAQCYRWLRLYDDYRVTAERDEALAMRYKPLLSYALRDSSAEMLRSYQDLLNHTHPAWRYLRVWVQWALYRLRER